MNQSLIEVMQNQSNLLITFDTQLKTALRLIEQVSIECRNTKTKVITLANQEGWRDNPVNQSKLEVITHSGHRARENVHAQATVGFGFGFGFTTDWLKRWCENFEPITE